jgi:hypothetical protein
MDAKQQLKHILTDFPTYAKRCLKIRTKAGKLVKFDLNPAQLKLNTTIEQLRQQGKPIRIIILKARQMGFSTYTEGRIFHRTATAKLVNSLIIAHKEDASTNLFNMSKLFYEEMPATLRPMKRASNAKELIFENPDTNVNRKSKNPGLRSKIKIDTAKNLGAGRSDTIHCLHASEVAFWDRAEEVMLGLMQAVPNTPDTMVVLESTANGVGGYFYDMWHQAQRGENDFTPLFYAWWEHPEYTMTAKNFVPTDEELTLQAIYNLTDSQLTWRRWCIANNCGGDETLFRQEYPACPEEAFITSGRPVFDTAKLLLRREQVRGKGESGYLQDGKFVPDTKGQLIIYKHPEPGKPYVIGGDVAEGVAGGDYSVSQVLDNITGEQVAVWRGHIDPDLYADEQIKLARYYNGAMVANEVNNHGLTTIKALEYKGYTKQYIREVVDEISKKRQHKYGFRTDVATRPVIIDGLREVARECPELINDATTIDEMLTFVFNQQNKPEAQEGCHDDCVLSLAIAYGVRDQQTTKIKLPEPDKTVIQLDKERLAKRQRRTRRRLA